MNLNNIQLDYIFGWTKSITLSAAVYRWYSIESFPFVWLCITIRSYMYTWMFNVCWWIHSLFYIEKICNFRWSNIETWLHRHIVLGQFIAQQHGIISILFWWTLTMCYKQRLIVFGVGISRKCPQKMERNNAITFDWLGMQIEFDAQK